MEISAKMRETGGLFASPFIYQLMRISVIVTFILVTSGQLLLATATKGQNMRTDRVTLGLHRESLSTALKKIEGQTQLRFFYRKSEIKYLSFIELPQVTRK